MASVILGIAVTLLPIARVSWAPLTFGCWFFASLFSYLLVRLVLQKEFETASLRAPVLLTAPLLVSAAMLFFGGSAMLAELAVAGAIAVGVAYVAHRSSAQGRGFVEVILLFHFLLLLNCITYADLPFALAWLQWIVPALVIVLPEPLQLQKTDDSPRSGNRHNRRSRSSGSHRYGGFTASSRIALPAASMFGSNVVFRGIGDACRIGSGGSDRRGGELRSSSLVAAWCSVCRSDAPS